MNSQKMRFAAVFVLGVSSVLQAAYFHVIDQAVEVQSCIRIGDDQGNTLAQDSYWHQAGALAQYAAEKYVVENPQDAYSGQACASVRAYAQITTPSLQQISLSTRTWQDYSVCLCDTIDDSTGSVYTRAQAWVMFEIQGGQGYFDVTGQSQWGDHGMYQSGLINLFDVTINQYVYFDSQAGVIGPDQPALDQTGTARLSANHLYLLTCVSEADASGFNSGPVHETSLMIVSPSQMPIPEPATLSILLIGAVATGLTKKR